MEKQRQTNTIDSSTQEAVAGLDPLLQPFDDQNDVPVYYSRRSSVFYIPATAIDKNNEENINSNKKSNLLTKILSYIERFSGIIYALIASLLFTCSNFLIKQLDVVILDVFLIRFVIQGFISLGYIIYKGYHPFSSNYNGLLIFIQPIIAATGSICFYIGLTLLPLPDLTTIRYTQVVWTALLALIIFRERITLPTILAIILTLIGVICVAQPSFLFTKSKIFNETLQISLSKTNENRLLGMFIALLCAFSISTTVVLTKKLFEKKVRQSIIMFHFILTTFIFLLIIQIHYWAFSKTNQQKFHIKKIYLTKNFFYATILATLQLIPMVLSQKSIKREHPSIVTVVQASDILFAIILQNLFSINKSNGLALIGSTLVLASIIIVGVHKLWQDRQNRTCIPTSIQENK
jgi:drug/metabolite transporter (DMT)-like permease